MEIATILALVKFAIDEEPAVQTSLQKIFSKPDPTESDWQAEIDATRAASYAKLVPNSQLPPDAPPTTPTA